MANVSMIKALTIGLTDSEIEALKSGDVVTLASGITLIKGDDGKAHICKGKAIRPFNRFEVCVDSGNDIFRMTGDEMREAIDNYRKGIDKPIVCYRTASAEESRANPETCSIQVLIKLLPNNGVNGMESNRFSDWHIDYHEVVYVKNAYTLGDAVGITRIAEEVAL